MDKPWVIFDMDGTLIDSMPYWRQLTSEYLRSKGVGAERCKELELQVRKLSLLESAALFRRELGVDLTPTQIELEMGDLMDVHYQNDIPLKPGVKEYLTRLQQEGAALCVATLTPIPLARRCLERLDIAEDFVFMLSCDDVGAGKDQPDLFLQCAWEFGADVRETAVFEDSLEAAITAKRAGFWTVGVYDESGKRQWPQMQTVCDEIVLDWREALEYL